jgi:hypothetical protein
MFRDRVARHYRLSNWIGPFHSKRTCHRQVLMDSQLCNKLQCRASGFVQSPESQYYRDPVLATQIETIGRLHASFCRAARN